MVFNRDEYINSLTDLESLFRERDYIHRVAFIEHSYSNEEERSDLIEKLRIVGEKFAEYRSNHPNEPEEPESQEWIDAWGGAPSIVPGASKRPREDSDEDSEEWRQAMGCPEPIVRKS